MPLCSLAQSPIDGLGLKVQRFERADSVLRIDIATNLDSRRVRSTQRWEVTPFVVSTDGTHRVEMPQMVVNGRFQRQMERRWEKIHKGTPRETGATLIYENLRRGSRRAPVYSHEVAWQNWMNDSWLELHSRYFTCSRTGEQHMRVIKTAIPAPATKPRAELTKPAPKVVLPVDANGKGSLKQTAMIEFPVNGHEIDPTLARNSEELGKIRDVLAAVRDSEMVLVSLALHGYASPEGKFYVNDRLAAQRVEALKQWIVNTFGISSDRVSTSRTPEDWAGLRRAVAASSLPDKAALLGIIDSNEAPDTKEAMLRTHSSWSVLLRDFMPALRRTEYTVDYKVRN